MRWPLEWMRHFRLLLTTMLMITAFLPGTARAVRFRADARVLLTKTVAGYDSFFARGTSSVFAGLICFSCALLPARLQAVLCFLFKTAKMWRGEAARNRPSAVVLCSVLFIAESVTKHQAGKYDQARQGAFLWKNALSLAEGNTREIA